MQMMINNQVDEAFAFLDKKLNMITCDQYHIKTVKEGDTIYIAPVIVGAGGKRGSMFLLMAAAVVVGPMIMASMGTSATLATTISTRDYFLSA